MTRTAVSVLARLGDRAFRQGPPCGQVRSSEPDQFAVLLDTDDHEQATAAFFREEASWLAGH